MGSATRKLVQAIEAGGYDNRVALRRNRRAVREQKAAMERRARLDRKAKYASGELPKCGGHER